jgi:hypothetical protein
MSPDETRAALNPTLLLIAGPSVAASLGYIHQDVRSGLTPHQCAVFTCTRPSRHPMAVFGLETNRPQGPSSRRHSRFCNRPPAAARTSLSRDYPPLKYTVQDAAAAIFALQPVHRTIQLISLPRRISASCFVLFAPRVPRHSLFVS